jgi:CubicO group peptidase (beta-lactamase class C family)
MNKLQIKIQSLLNELVDQGIERGVQAALYYQGQLIVDAFAGIANPQTRQIVTGETLFPVFSTGKGITATIIHRLVERGAFNYETPLAQFWPEFAAHGKEKITVRHALNHTAGLPNIPTGIDFYKITDWDYMCRAIANMEPAYAVGSKVEYHAITYGWLLGEFAQRVTGQNFSDLTQQEICEPLGIKTLFFGVPAELEPFVAVLEDKYIPEIAESDKEKPAAIPNWIWPLGNWLNTPAGRKACLPASNGIMNARAIARHYAALVPRGVDGVELLPPSRVEIARTPENLDLTEGTPRFGLGYGIADTAFGHGGHGGSLGLVDPKAGWAFGFTRNRFSEENSSERVLNEIKQFIATV